MKRGLPLAACAALIVACGTGPAPPAAGPPPAPTCTDGVQNGGETGVDCGGPCAPCAAGSACTVGPDCSSGVCAAGTCAAPSCTDGVRNGDETGVDCGGPTCPACAPGTGCTSGTECATGVCLHGACDCGDDTGVYVSETGDDAHPGTAAAPLRTIQAAVACAHWVPREVRVAKGTYEASDKSRIELQDGRSLVGGWSADFAARDPVAYPTAIVDTTDTGKIGSSVAGVAVYVSSSSTETVLEGFTIKATWLGGGIRATALMVTLPPVGAPGARVLNNVFECGGSPQILLAPCIDLGTSGGRLVVEGNDIHLGSSEPFDPISGSGGTSWGIRGEYGGVSDVEIVGNRFDGGSSATVIAIHLAAAPATAVVRNNVIAVSGGAVGIEDGTGAEISNNTIVAGTGSAILTTVAGARVRNNAVQTAGGGTCLAAAGATAAPAPIGHNDLFGCATLYTDGTTSFATIAALEQALAGASGNLGLDPRLDPANGYRPLATSPLLGAGLDLSSLFTTDKAGATRTAPWSIGAYQSAAP